MNKEELKEKVRNLPMNSGVYIMKNHSGEIIYIGKAKHLKNRVKQYFDGGEKQIKVQAMVDNIADFDYILTSNDVDAFLLENNLIKKHKPKYNILLKDDKQYPYIKITTGEKYPQVLVTRKILDDNAMYFGPFVNMSVNYLIEIIRTAFKIRTCKQNIGDLMVRKIPCLHGQIGNCLSPCAKANLQEEYNEAIKKVVEFLKGDSKEILKRLTEKMNEYAENEDFENAILIRDKISMVERLGEKHFASLTSLDNFDAFAIYRNLDFVVINTMMVRFGRNVGQFTTTLEYTEDEDSDILIKYILDYYQNPSLVPKTILVNCACTDNLEKVILQAFGKKAKIIFPQKGEKLQIIKMCETNAKEFVDRVDQRSKQKINLTTGALRELEDILSIAYINRIEGYDISNIQGNYNVASMVVFENGEAIKKEYRKFKIKTVEGSDDFASMKETLKRRFERLKSGDEKFSTKPDLILIDGGLGQLHSASDAIEDLGFSVPIISLAKKDEEIYTIYSNEPIKLDRRSYALRLLQRVRDESHRFAITFHRNTRNQEFLSEFEKIEGVGKKTRLKLLAEYKSVEDLYNSDKQELKSRLKISDKTACNIYEYLHPVDNINK